MINNNAFKKIIVVFWALWWAIALWTDVVGGLAHLKLINSSWAPDINYPALTQSLTMYHVPMYVPVFLFVAIILWSTVISALFLWACLGLRQADRVWMQRAQPAFIVSLMFWLAFFVADQIVMNFNIEQNHMVQGGFELLTYLALYLLPEKINDGATKCL